MDEIDERAEEKKRLISPRRDTIWTALEITQGRSLSSVAGNCGSTEERDQATWSNYEWAVEYKENRGLKEPTYFNITYSSKDEAEFHFEIFKNGHYIFEDYLAAEPSNGQLHVIQSLLDQGEVHKSRHFRTETPNELPHLVLEIVDIINPDGETSSSVLNTIGAERTSNIQKNFPNSWRYVVEMEYAMRLLSKDSAAYVAVAVRYCASVTKEYALAGYLLRDLEALCRDTDDVFLKEYNRLINSGIKSKEATKLIMREKRKALVKRMSDFLKKREKLPPDRPLSAERLALTAAQHLKRYRNKYWKRNGQESIDNHLSIIGSGEEGNLLKKNLKKIEDEVEKLYKS